MPDSDRPRVLLLADASRQPVADVVSELRACLSDHAQIVCELPADDAPLPGDLQADLAIAVGGDGTLISQSRRLLETGLPLVGVNVGRLGFLAEFDVADLIGQADLIFGPHPPVREHMLLSARVIGPDGSILQEDIALNDCVVSNGEPFRMIELSLSVDDQVGPILTGDGVIVATPIGSTAYNVSAGGPIVHRDQHAIIITPLAAHSLAFRPIVIGADSVLRIKMLRTIPGTVLVSDGRISANLAEGQTVTIQRHTKRARIVDNPSTSYWNILMDKMRWAAPPTYRDRGG